MGSEFWSHFWAIVAAELVFAIGSAVALTWWGRFRKQPWALPLVTAFVTSSITTTLLILAFAGPFSRSLGIAIGSSGYYELEVWTPNAKTRESAILKRLMPRPYITRNG